MFKDNIITYIHNRIQLESSDAVIAEEVMSRFPVWIKLYNCDNNTQKEFIKFLCYGMRMEMKMYKKGE